MNLSMWTRKDRNSNQDPLPSNRKRDRSEATERPDSKQEPKAGSARRKKVLSAIWRLFATAIIAGATVGTGLAVYRHATTSKYFTVTEFEVKGVRRLSEVEVIKTAGFSKGGNIFAVDVEQAKVKLDQHPWIAGASVKRHLPRSVDIDVTERIPVATILLDVPYLVDDTGEVFKRWARGDPTPAPVLTGFSREHFVDDPTSVHDTVRDAIDLSRRYNAAGLMKTAPLAEIHYEVDGSFSFAIEGDPLYVRFGNGPYRTKLKRFATLLSKLRRNSHRPTMIFFDNEVRPDRVTVKIKKHRDKKGEEAKKTVSSSNLQKRMSKI
ncbi:MAG: FtsQ-type POTRA domain-containing protein [Proteobacteria bacterium]|nr:FtsQ-type POTRA domain-containing protein [Pseudomonadota bacterium]